MLDAMLAAYWDSAAADRNPDVMEWGIDEIADGPFLVTLGQCHLSLRGCPKLACRSSSCHRSRDLPRRMDGCRRHPRLERSESSLRMLRDSGLNLDPMPAIAAEHWYSPLLKATRIFDLA